MTIDNIIQEHETLEKQLRLALSTMESKDTIKEIRVAMLELQDKCPHYSDKYQWTHPGYCPFCGKEGV